MRLIPPTRPGSHTAGELPTPPSKSQHRPLPTKARPSWQLLAPAPRGRCFLPPLLHGPPATTAAGPLNSQQALLQHRHPGDSPSPHRAPRGFPYLAPTSTSTDSHCLSPLIPMTLLVLQDISVHSAAGDVKAREGGE